MKNEMRKKGDAHTKFGPKDRMDMDQLNLVKGGGGGDDGVGELIIKSGGRPTGGRPTN